MGMTHPYARAHAMRRATLATTALLLAMATTACEQVRDMGEELGVVKPPRTAPVEAPAAPTLETHWIPADVEVEGTSQTQWSERWWQWTGRFPAPAQAPQLDPDGSRCTQFQEGPVWYLAGTDGNFDAVRNCTIPAGKHLFVPLINWVVTSELRGVPMSCEEKTASVTRMADHVMSGLVLLDGRPVGELKRMRIASRSCFDAFHDSPTGASDGYWLMLKPLPPGKHQLAIAAAFRDGPKQMLQNFRYELDVQAEAGGTEVGAGAEETVEAPAQANQTQATPAQS